MKTSMCSRWTLARILVQKHLANSWHYDLRLEDSGVFKSWAVPKGFPQDNSKHLAIAVTDHDLEQCWRLPLRLNTDTIVMQTKARFETLDKRDGYWSFKVRGGKFKGCWKLVRMSGKNWLLSKEEA